MAFTSRYVVLHILPLDCFPTFERTFYWIVGTCFIMTTRFCNGMIGIPMLLAVFAYIRPKVTINLQVTIHFSSPHLLSTSCALHFSMGTFGLLVNIHFFPHHLMSTALATLYLSIATARLVGVKIFQSSFPLTATLMVFTVDLQLLYFPYTYFVQNMLGVLHSALWAGWVSLQPFLKTWFAIVLSTALSKMGF